MAEQGGALELLLAVACNLGTTEASRALHLLAAVLTTPANRQTFFASQGASKVLALIKDATGQLACISVLLHRVVSTEFPVCTDESALVEAAAKVAAAACTQHEDNKSAFMTEGIADVFVAALGKEPTQPGEVTAICRAVRRLTTADDARPVVSRLVKIQ